MQIEYRNTVTSEDMQLAVRGTSAALDALWSDGWVRDSITKADLEQARTLQAVADALAGECDTLLVVAGGDAALSVKACLGAVPAEEGRPEVIVFGDTLSPGDYSDLFSRLEGRKPALFAADGGSDDLALRASYAILKDLVFRQARRGGYSPHIYAAVSSRSSSIAEDALENEYETAELGSGYKPLFSGNTAAAVFPIAVKSGSAPAYVEGFAETVSSPEWDSSYPCIASSVISCLSEAKSPVRVMAWQREYAGWLALSRRFGLRPFFLPKDLVLRDSENMRDGFDLLILADETYDDVMTPPFEGCDPDGSLRLLTLSTATDDFFGTGSPDGAALRFRSADSRSAGQLAAYMQITFGICEKCLL